MMREEKLERLSTMGTSLDDPFYLHLLYLFESIAESAPLIRGRLIDLGCGNKPYSALFGDVSEYIGCDVVQSSKNLADVLCDVTNVPMADSSFDTVFSSQVIEHVRDPQSLCREAFRLLRTGGYFILAGPMYWPLHEEPHDFYRFTKHGFTHLLETAGFEVVKISSNGGKWSMVGLVMNHAVIGGPFHKPFVVRMINRIFGWMDEKVYDDISTSNYVIVAKKNDAE